MHVICLPFFSLRKRKLGLAVAGCTVGHGITLFSYLNFDRIEVGDFEVNMAPAGGFIAYMAITQGTGGLIFYILGQMVCTGMSAVAAMFAVRQWITERNPELGSSDTPDLLKLLGDLRATTPPPTKMDPTGGHITQMGAVDDAVVVGLRSVYALFSAPGTGGMTREKLTRFLKGDKTMEEEMLMPHGKPFKRENLTESQFKMLDIVQRCADVDENGEISFRSFAFSAIIYWAARDGNPQAQQVVMFKVMARNGNTNKIGVKELEPWMKLLEKHNLIKEEDKTTRAWHLLAFRDVDAKELAQIYMKQVDTRRNGEIDMGEFARMSVKWNFSLVFEDMIDELTA